MYKQHYVDIAMVITGTRGGGRKGAWYEGNATTTACCSWTLSYVYSRRVQALAGSV